MMDHRIYGPLPRTDLGTYGTRRFPKGGNVVAPGSAAAQDPFNRNPSTLALVYRAPAVAGPAVDIERFRYTVPIRRRALLQAVQVEMNRAIAGAGNQLSYIFVRLQRAEGPQIELVRVTSHNDGVGSNDREIHTGEVHIYEGDTLICMSSIPSGSMTFLAAVHGVEYDAEEKVYGATYDATTDNSGLAGFVAGMAGTSFTNKLKPASALPGAPMTLTPLGQPGADPSYLNAWLK